MLVRRLAVGAFVYNVSFCPLDMPGYSRIVEGRNAGSSGAASQPAIRNPKAESLHSATINSALTRYTYAYHEEMSYFTNAKSLSESLRRPAAARNYRWRHA
jgi:hypothetical protein